MKRQSMALLALSMMITGTVNAQVICAGNGPFTSVNNKTQVAETDSTFVRVDEIKDLIRIELIDRVTGYKLTTSGQSKAFLNLYRPDGSVDGVVCVKK